MLSVAIEIALATYGFIFITVFSLSRWKYNTTFWSSLAISILFSTIVLLIIYPISRIYDVRKKKAFVGLYLLILAVGIIILVAYIFDKATKDQYKNDVKYDFYPLDKIERMLN
jgi:amino acid permease